MIVITHYYINSITAFLMNPLVKLQTGKHFPPCFLVNWAALKHKEGVSHYNTAQHSLWNKGGGGKLDFGFPWFLLTGFVEDLIEPVTPSWFSDKFYYLFLFE